MVWLFLIAVGILFIRGFLQGFQEDSRSPPLRRDYSSSLDDIDFAGMIAEFEASRAHTGRNREEDTERAAPECYVFTEAGERKVTWEGERDYELIQEALGRR